MGGKPSICGGGADETLEDEGDAVGQEEKKAAADPTFCEKLYKKISETDKDYSRDFAPDEPALESNKITICQFKRWANRTAKCNPLWRRAMKADDKIDIKKFEIALSADEEYIILGQLLMDIKLAQGDGELLQPHLKAREHWFGWEISKTKKYFQEILKESGKSDDDVLTCDDLRNYGNARHCLDIRIDYAFGYTTWNEAQKCLDNENTNSPKFVTFSVGQMQNAFTQKGKKTAYKELGQLLRAFASAVAAPGTHVEDVGKNDMFYWEAPKADSDGDAFPDLKGGNGGEGGCDERKELKEKPEIEDGHAFPSLGPKSDDAQPSSENAQPASDDAQQENTQPPNGEKQSDKQEKKNEKQDGGSQAYPTLG